MEAPAGVVALGGDVGYPSPALLEPNCSASRPSSCSVSRHSFADSSKYGVPLNSSAASALARRTVRVASMIAIVVGASYPVWRARIRAATVHRSAQSLSRRTHLMDITIFSGSCSAAAASAQARHTPAHSYSLSTASPSILGGIPVSAG
ncbi:hypothetical protein ACGFXB_11740 [Streptomyces canus]|uniref:hypothetical protein n=1 Tax=Streptomyces canus TaxID=58343 RepID=UPI00371FC719